MLAWLLHADCRDSYSFALPDDVFAPGETKPTRPLKKKGVQPPNGAKRKSPAEVCGEKGSPSVARSRNREALEDCHACCELSP